MFAANTLLPQIEAYNVNAERERADKGFDADGVGANSKRECQNWE